MSQLTKRRKVMKELHQPDQHYAPAVAIGILKECPPTKFNESVDVSINLGVDPRKSDQVIRGSSNLPHGLGKSIKVAVFTQGDNLAKAQDAGADDVGLEDLVEKVKKGDFDWDVVIASPDAMPVLGKIGQLLGPRGLMPNPKDGTVTQDVAQAVSSAKAGQARYRTDKAGIIHCSIGTLAFEANQLEENLNALISDIKDLKPSSSKGIYIKKLSISSTMGLGIKIDQSVY